MANSVNMFQLDSQEKMQEKQMVQDEKMQKQQMEQTRKMAAQPQNTPKPNSGRPTGKSDTKTRESKAYSVQNIMDVMKRINGFFSTGEKIYKKAIGTKRMTKQRKATAGELCAKVIASTKEEEWEEQLKEICVDPEKLLYLETNEEIKKIADDHMLDDYAASILYHSLN